MFIYLTVIDIRCCALLAMFCYITYQGGVLALPGLAVIINFVIRWLNLSGRRKEKDIGKGR